MDNRNMMIEVTVDNDATQRCVGLLTIALYRYQA